MSFHSLYSPVFPTFPLSPTSVTDMLHTVNGGLSVFAPSVPHLLKSSLLELYKKGKTEKDQEMQGPLWAESEQVLGSFEKKREKLKVFGRL